MATTDGTELTVRLPPAAADALHRLVERSGSAPDDVIAAALVRADQIGPGEAEVRWAVVLQRLADRDEG